MMYKYYKELKVFVRTLELAVLRGAVTLSSYLGG